MLKDVVQHEFYTGAPHREGEVATIVASYIHGSRNTETRMDAKFPHRANVYFRDLGRSRRPDVSVTSLPNGTYRLCYSPRVYLNGHTPETIERLVLKSLTNNSGRAI